MRRLMDLDSRYGLFTVVIPLAIVSYGTIFIGCIAMDRQKELRWFRVQSISRRELEMEEEREEMMRILAIGDDYENQPAPQMED